MNDDMLAVIGEYATILTSDQYDLAIAAYDWDNEGFTADEVAKWAQAKCFDAMCARQLQRAGVSPELAATLTDAGQGEYADTIGYKYANGDLTLTEAAALADA